MINMMKADVQRIFRGKGIYITLVCFFIMTIFTLYSESITMNVYIQNEMYQQIEALGLGQLELNGVNAAFKVMGSAEGIFYIMLPIIIFIAATDFSSGAVKNVLATEASRVEYYFSKLILSSIFAFVVLILYVTIPIIFATIRYGFGGMFDMAFVISILKPFLAQFLILLAFTCVVIFLIFMTKRTAAVIGISIALLSIPPLIIQFLVLINVRFESFKAFDLSTNMKALANIAEFSTGDTVKYLLVGVVYILVSTIAGILLFRKSEIK